MMTTLHKTVLLAGLSCFLLVGMGMTQPRTATPHPRPDEPQTYLDLGERLAAEARSETEIEQAGQILAMGVLIAERNADLQLAASCCIALSTLSHNPELKRDLWDLALMLDPQRFQSWVGHRAQETVSNDARDAADCLRLIRNAEYQDASARFSRSSVKSQLGATALSLGYEPVQALDRIRLLLADARDDDCKGRVFVTRVRDGASSKHLCTDHSHPIGTAPDEPTLRMLLSIELACMNAAGQLNDWGGATAMSLDQPLRAPDTRLLQMRYKIDPQRPYWDGSRWTEMP